MSQTASLYRISEEIFNEIEESEDRSEFIYHKIAKSDAHFDGSFVALEFILSKGRNDYCASLAWKIFNPTCLLSTNGFDDMSDEEKFEYVDTGNLVLYLDLVTISSIHKFIGSISESEIDSKYNSEELKIFKIYPQNAWHDDNSLNRIFNKRQVVEDFIALKKIFEEAFIERDYILVFIG